MNVAQFGHYAFKYSYTNKKRNKKCLCGNGMPFMRYLCELFKMQNAKNKKNKNEMYILIYI